MSGRAFLLPERPEEAKSNTGSTSVISGPLYHEERDRAHGDVSCLAVKRRRRQQMVDSDVNLHP
ncbi:hypothetical protein EYF80_003541 [Liparis tanakae]|uniref:Uncharacterized protein n=1 Tax=Liparis tanakae TaxID=230148 RepID=A0A4Z2J8E3_9TELE|nr:hypothetical protein EYF80_003541 [Liparis tanakae]